MALLINIGIFVIACVLAWYPGNRILWFVWSRIIAPHRQPTIGKQLPLSQTIGGLERILYIFGVMIDRYEIITGWLVMKAFFGWIVPEPEEGRENNPSDKYYRFLIGNILSLLFGLLVGLGAKLIAKISVCDLL